MVVCVVMGRFNAVHSALILSSYIDYGLKKFHEIKCKSRIGGCVPERTIRSSQGESSLCLYYGAARRSALSTRVSRVHITVYGAGSTLSHQRVRSGRTVRAHLHTSCIAMRGERRACACARRARGRLPATAATLPRCIEFWCSSHVPLTKPSIRHLYYQLLMRLKQEVEKKRPELFNRKGVVLHHDNARPHF
ncbi:hypothetical protein EVAR_29503_1 [Eumeta japonica]|uniref:Histone-lysine N-methyltransferase SETMAR n=1 Tax=Eumeta variegata TaxID=151549 RepID=A0A4C1WGB8_EUMVA|nr:hypothetical protein EVAR_29503_1 [Eumeta japonica]